MPPAMPAQKRRTKTRTRTVSNRPALVVSTLHPNHIDLLPGTESLVCPDCNTWCPITGHQSSTPKLVPHHAARAGTPGARRCTGSNRRIVLDLTIPAWYEALGDAIADTVSRQATRVVRKAGMAPSQARIPQQRADEWAKYLPAVQLADAQRAQHPEGDTPTDGPHVPLEPLRITA